MLDRTPSLTGNQPSNLPPSESPIHWYDCLLDKLSDAWEMQTNPLHTYVCLLCRPPLRRELIVLNTDRPAAHLTLIT